MVISNLLYKVKSMLTHQELNEHLSTVFQNNPEIGKVLIDFDELQGKRYDSLVKMINKLSDRLYLLRDIVEKESNT